MRSLQGCKDSPRAKRGRAAERSRLTPESSSRLCSGAKRQETESAKGAFQFGSNMEDLRFLTVIQDSRKKKFLQSRSFCGRQVVKLDSHLARGKMALDGTCAHDGFRLRKQKKAHAHSRACRRPAGRARRKAGNGCQQSAGARISSESSTIANPNRAPAAPRAPWKKPCGWLRGRELDEKLSATRTEIIPDRVLRCFR